MPGNLSFEALRLEVELGEIDTVVAAMVDMQGRLMGKRFHARHFVESAFQETHCCNYLLATDLEMHTVAGYLSTGWRAGYGDYLMKPDLSTMRRIPWLEKTALVICDVMDHHGRHEVAHSPRTLLKTQIARLEAMGLKPMAATELEFFLFEQSYEHLRDHGFRDLRPVSGYNADYAVFQTTKEEDVMRAIRNGLYGAGLPVEGSKGEAEAGQEEINIRYSDALDTADNHAVVKNGCKEIAWSKGKSITFMAKWRHDRVGSSSHIHMSLAKPDGASAFYDPAAEHGMSSLMRAFTAGQLAHTPELMVFLAPYVNSYKRLAKGTFAPTSAVWSPDNRTAGYRLCGEGTKAIRMECRIGGADLNPYLAMAALIAAGIAGIERNLELGAPFTGDAYQGDAPPLPRTLKEAAGLLEGSALLRSAFGGEVVDHYVRAARWEVEEHERVVTDWEVARAFERC